MLSRDMIDTRGYRILPDENGQWREEWVRDPMKSELRGYHNKSL